MYVFEVTEKKRISLNLYLNIHWMKFKKKNEKQQTTDPKRHKTLNTLNGCKKIDKLYLLMINKI